jgi:ferritin
MVVRRRAVSITKNEELETYFARLARSGEMDADDLEQMARWLERDKRSDKKHNRRIARYREAQAIEDRLDDLVKSGVPLSEAKQRLHNSVEALDKFLIRNRRRPKLD